MSEFDELDAKFADFEKKAKQATNLKKEIKNTEIEVDPEVKAKLQNSLKSDDKLNDIEEELDRLRSKLVESANKSDVVVSKDIDIAKDEPEKTEQPIKKDLFKPKNIKASSAKDLLSVEAAQQMSAQLKSLLSAINMKVIGQDATINKVLLAILCDGHALLEGVPGLAKSLLVEVLSRVVADTSFNRIQFIPDLLPSDILGGQIYNPKTSEFKTFKGPIFANFILADEINRAPPKTHAALMECMQEKKVNIDKDEFILDRPFLVLATMNPLENKGTYSLPEAVLDRFIFKIIMDYPKKEDEMLIITQNATTNNNYGKSVKSLINKKDLLIMQQEAKKVYISNRIKEYILDLVSASRGLNKNIEGRKFIKYGGGPRASIYLGIASKSRALLMGRNYVIPDDVQFVFADVMRHRICLNYKGKAHNITSDKIIEEIILTINSV